MTKPHPHVSIAAWVLLLVLADVADLFLTPALMNHTHGSGRTVLFALSILPAWPLSMLGFRIYQKVRSYLFVKHNL